MTVWAGRPLGLLISGVLALFIAMGVGRFAYTPILPFMMERQFFGEAGAGALASANYAGYLAGAVMAAWFSGSERRLGRLKLSLVISVLTTALMGLTTLFPLWLALRFISGFAGAAVFVYASGVVMDGLAGLRGFAGASVYSTAESGRESPLPDLRFRFLRHPLAGRHMAGARAALRHAVKHGLAGAAGGWRPQACAARIRLFRKRLSPRGPANASPAAGIRPGRPGIHRDRNLFGRLCKCARYEGAFLLELGAGRGGSYAFLLDVVQASGVLGARADALLFHAAAGCRHSAACGFPDSIRFGRRGDSFWSHVHGHYDVGGFIGKASGGL